MNYNKKIANYLCELIESDDYTDTELCQLAKISRNSFYKWLRIKPEFSIAIQNAKEARLATFRKAAKSGLLTLLQGKEWEEVTTEIIEGKPDENGISKPRIKSKKIVKKYILPNPTSVIFTLKNLEPEIFSDTFKGVFSGDINFNPKDMTLDDLSKIPLEKILEHLEAIKQ